MDAMMTRMAKTMAVNFIAASNMDAVLKEEVLGYIESGGEGIAPVPNATSADVPAGDPTFVLEGLRNGVRTKLVLYREKVLDAQPMVPLA
ncbi:MAG: hypothetical protein JSS87_12860 [Acidobacteria bacterium]|nr:hypothetical protein [Acidobacteriota bacterium]